MHAGFNPAGSRHGIVRSMSQLNSIARRVLLEADAQGSEPEEPSYWDAAGREAGRWADAAAELGSDAASMAGTVAKAALDTVVGQAHAPRDEEDVRQAKASRVTLPKLVLNVMGELLPHVALTKFRISAKIMDAIGLPVREITAGRYGEDVAKDIYTGSVLHDILMTTSMIPGGIVASMLLDSFVYAAEGDRKAAIAAIAMAGLFSAPAASATASVKGAAKELTAAKYTELSGKLGGAKQITIVRGQEAAAKAAEEIGYRMERAGVKDARRLGREAGWTIRTNRLDATPALNASRVAAAEKATSDLMALGAGGESALARAKRKWGEVSVDRPTVMDTGRYDSKDVVTSWGREEIKARSLLPNTPDAKFLGTEVEKAAIRRAQTTMQSAQFVTQAKRLYRNLGVNVNIKPIAGSMSSVFEETGLAKYNAPVSKETKAAGFRIARVTLTTNEEAAPILRALGVSEKGLTPMSTTIVPVSNAAGIDALPTPWMIAHAMFDTGPGNLLQTMSRTKTVFDEVGKVFDELAYQPRSRTVEKFAKIKYGVPMPYEANARGSAVTDLYSDAVAAREATDPVRALGLTVNSGWGQNSREIIKAELEGVAAGKMKHGDITRKKAAPPVGQRIGGKGTSSLRDIGDRGSKSYEDALSKTQAGAVRARDYFNRSQGDRIAEILAAALTKSEGYVPDFSHILKDHPYRSQIEDAAKRIQKITAGLPEAFAADTQGKVVWVAVN